LEKNRPSSGAALSAGAEASVRQLIANGKYKVAVETAKEIHKAQSTAASEALLLDAYAAPAEWTPAGSKSWCGR
jgi:hypothetical protein